MAQVAIHPGLFSDPPDARLLAGRCGDCGDAHFPRAEVCPYCTCDAIETEAVGATGTLYLHTVVNAAPPGYRGPVPYGFGLVDLPEGLRVVTRLVSDDLSALASGMAMRLRVAPLFSDDEGNDVLSWAYEPADADRT